MRDTRDVPRVLITAPKSGSGKTTFTCGLIAALLLRGIKVRSFKCGPDYIDPMFHRMVLGIPSGNLDSYFTEEGSVRRLLAERTDGAGFAVLEGAMGYYDGLGGESLKGSACEIGLMTGTPAVLVLDAKGMSFSAAALVKGALTFRENSIKAVVLNRVSESYFPKLRKAVEEECHIPVLGFLPEPRSYIRSSYVN